MARARRTFRPGTTWSWKASFITSTTARLAVSRAGLAGACTTSPSAAGISAGRPPWAIRDTRRGLRHRLLEETVASGKQRTASDTTSSKTPSRSGSKPEPEPPDWAHGRVQRVYAERGFGFIRCTEGSDIGQDYFFHMSGLDDCEIADLEEGSVVKFEARNVAKGRRAEHIQRAL